jgi:hypothetical protein
LDLIPTFRATYLLVVSGDLTVDEKTFLACVKNGSSRMKVRSRCKTKKGIDWILEINIRNESALVDQVAAVPGINCVNLMSHDGDVRF